MSLLSEKEPIQVCALTLTSHFEKAQFEPCSNQKEMCQLSISDDSSWHLMIANSSLSKPFSNRSENEQFLIDFSQLVAEMVQCESF